MASRNYYETFDALRGVYLEGSWVLHVALPHEQHCYEPSTLSVESDSSIRYEPSNAPPARDAAGEEDPGHIDTFYAAAPELWRLTGDWGLAEVRSLRVSVEPRQPAE